MRTGHAHHGDRRASPRDGEADDAPRLALLTLTRGGLGAPTDLGIAFGLGLSGKFRSCDLLLFWWPWLPFNRSGTGAEAICGPWRAWFSARTVGCGHSRRRVHDQARRFAGWSWNAIADSYAEHLAALQDFAKREGHTRVPVDFVENGLKLGQWTRLRRAEHKNLSVERQKQLESLPGWYWGRSGDYAWEQKLAVLKKFVDREGHARVPSAHAEDGAKIGMWAAQQRSERSILSPERVARLEALPGWTWTVSDDTWDERYALLRAFVAREGHARVPQSHFENGVNLGKWVGVQRQKRESLTQERRSRVESVPGWSWDPHADRWDAAFNLLEKYAEEHRTSRVPYSYKVDDLKLGVWVSEQRSQYSKGEAGLLETKEAGAAAGLDVEWVDAKQRRRLGTDTRWRGRRPTSWRCRWL